MPVLAKASLYVGVDVGTQGTKALVYDSKKNKVVARGARPYEIEKTKVPGRAEQHPSLWIEVCYGYHAGHALLQGCGTSAQRAQEGFGAIKKALEQVDRKEVRSRPSGISGQQHGFVPVDEHGQVPNSQDDVILLTSMMPH